MRVLMYGWEFPPHISGGLGVACYELTRALVEQGHRVTFVLPRLKSSGDDGNGHVELVGIAQFLQGLEGETELEKPGRDFLQNVDVAAVDSPLRPYLRDLEYREVVELLERTAGGRRGRGRPNGLDLVFSGDYGDGLIEEALRYARVAGEVARRVPHDVIHAHDWLTMLAGIEARRVGGRPLVVQAHALEFDRSGRNVNRAVYDIERAGMHCADKVIAVSHLTKRTIVERYGVPEDKVEVVHNAVSKRPRPAKAGDRARRRDKVVLFLGRITFQKGPDYFVEAAARLLEHRDDVRFVMAGSGDMAPRMIERVAELRIGRRFHFTGFLTGVDVERMYLESDVYVMPSVSEPFGISPLEAMAHSVPVIISKQSGVSEILRHALKVDFWDVDELANKIGALLDHTPLRDELSRRGSRELESIQWSKAARRLSDIYGRLSAGTAASEGRAR
ncbi:MAG: glycosyltransferase family 4 protein [Polyangia bacterium]